MKRSTRFSVRRSAYNPNSEVEMGSARVPRASSGVTPELSPHNLNGLAGTPLMVERGFRRDAENHTPEACAPRLDSEFGPDVVPSPTGVGEGGHRPGEGYWGRTRFLDLAFLFVLVSTCAANTAFNPYSAIVDRNPFGLRPPTKVEPPPPPPPPASKIKLQGITTILGRKQVLFKTQVPAQPPEYPAPREIAMVLSEGQRDGDIEVLEVNPAAGTVKFNNAGKIESLNMQDDSDKPAAGAVPPAPGGGVPPPTMPKLPGLPPPAMSSSAAPAIPSAAGASVTTFGGGAPSQNVSGFGNNASTAATAGAGQRNIPTRTLRTSAGGSSTTAAPGGEFQNISPEAQAILIEAQRAQLAPGGFDPLPKTAITPREYMSNPQPQQK